MKDGSPKNGENFIETFNRSAFDETIWPLGMKEGDTFSPLRFVGKATLPRSLDCSSTALVSYMFHIIYIYNISNFDN